MCGAEPGALADGILAALGAPDPAARRRAAREAVRDFDVDVRASALADVYARAAERPPRRTRAIPLGVRPAA